MKIALAAGHRNATGGGAPGEAALTGQLTPVVAEELRARGADVRVLTPNDGAGWSAGDLSQVAAQIVAMARSGWTADLFIELHFEAGGAEDGCFVIYPDWPAVGDTDTDVRDTIGPAIARHIASNTGLDVRGGGIMSERQTYVGATQGRLGIFAATALLKATLSRCIIEVAQIVADAPIIRHPEFCAQVADGIADALGLPARTPPAPPDGALRVLGLPPGPLPISLPQWLRSHQRNDSADRGLSVTAQQHLYGQCERLRVHPGLVLGLLELETAFGQSGAGPAGNNWLNLREDNPLAGAVVLDNGIRYEDHLSPELSIEEALIGRFTRYQKMGLVTLEAVLGRWLSPYPADGDSVPRAVKRVLATIAYVAKN